MSLLSLPPFCSSVYARSKLHKEQGRWIEADPPSAILQQASSPRWAFLRACGAGRERYTKAIKSSLRSVRPLRPPSLSFSLGSSLTFSLFLLLSRSLTHLLAHSLIRSVVPPLARLARSSNTVGVPLEHLQGGKLAIYELMAEESAVNYWEKYGNVSWAWLPPLSLLSPLFLALKLTSISRFLLLPPRRPLPSSPPPNQPAAAAADRPTDRLRRRPKSRPHLLRARQPSRSVEEAQEFGKRQGEEEGGGDDQCEFRGEEGRNGC